MWNYIDIFMMATLKLTTVLMFSLFQTFLPALCAFMPDTTVCPILISSIPVHVSTLCLALSDKRVRGRALVLEVFTFWFLIVADHVIYTIAFLDLFAFVD